MVFGIRQAIGLKLTPLQPTDIPTLQQWLSDESLFHLLAVEPLDYSKPFYLFVAREGESVIGWASVFNVDLWNGKAQVGLAAPGARQKALAIVGKLLWLAFTCLKLNRIAARVRSGNMIVIQALEGPLARRYGFFKEGVERQGYVRDGVVEDIHIYGLTKEVWERYGRGRCFGSNRRGCERICEQHIQPSPAAATVAAGA